MSNAAPCEVYKTSSRKLAIKHHQMDDGVCCCLKKFCDITKAVQDMVEEHNFSYQRRSDNWWRSLF